MSALARLFDAGMQTLRVITPQAEPARTKPEPARAAPEAKAITPFNDPFGSRHVERIYMFIYMHDGKPSVSGSVKFKNGETSGEQEFRADTLEELLLKIKFFIQTIDKK
jgi:hypothetical protein